MTSIMTGDLACQLGDHGVGSLGLKVGVWLSLRGETIHLDVNFSAFLFILSIPTFGTKKL